MTQSDLFAMAALETESTTDASAVIEPSDPVAVAAAPTEPDDYAPLSRDDAIEAMRGFFERSGPALRLYRAWRTLAMELGLPDPSADRPPELRR